MYTHLLPDPFLTDHQKVSKNPHHLNKLECCFFEYLYSYIKEHNITGGSVCLSMDDYIQRMGYLSGSDNNIRNCIKSLATHRFGDTTHSFSLYEIANIKGKNRTIELRLSDALCTLDRPYTPAKYLAAILSFEKYYSRPLFTYLLSHNPDLTSEGRDVYSFTIGGRRNDIFQILCSDLTHNNEIPALWSENFGYFRNTVLNPVLMEIRSRTGVSIEYMTGKRDEDGKSSRQFKQLVFYVSGRQRFLSASRIREVIDEIVPQKEESAPVPAPSMEPYTITPENLSILYPKSYALLQSYRITPHECVYLIRDAEKYMESGLKKDNWMQRYLNFYLSLCCPDKDNINLGYLKNSVGADVKTYAPITSKMIRMFG